MKGSPKRKCLCCGDFFAPDHRNVGHQRYCCKSACRKESKAQSQRRWLQRPENQNYFRGPENRQRVKDWRKAHPGYWRKKKSVPKNRYEISVRLKRLKIRVLQRQRYRVRYKKSG